MAQVNVGFGYDLHRLGAGRALVLGGVQVPFEKGLIGHSDADVLTHALIDALLGAAGLDDIGTQFPDTDPAWAGADSIELLKKVLAMLSEKKRTVVNADITVVAQEPKLGPYKAAIRQNLAAVLGVGVDDVAVKAKTAEGLGDIGAGQAMACYAAVLVQNAE